MRRIRLLPSSSERAAAKGEAIEMIRLRLKEIDPQKVLEHRKELTMKLSFLKTITPKVKSSHPSLVKSTQPVQYTLPLAMSLSLFSLVCRFSHVIGKPMVLHMCYEVENWSLAPEKSEAGGWLTASCPLRRLFQGMLGTSSDSMGQKSPRGVDPFSEPFGASPLILAADEE